MTIAKVTDTGQEILLALKPTSSDAVTAAGGVVNGAVTFSDEGMDCSAGGGISFTALNNYLKLDYEGQIVIKTATKAVCAKDDNAAAVTFSKGVDGRAADVYLYSSRNSSSANMGYLRVSTAGALAAKTHNTDTQISPKFNGAATEETTISFWWKGNEFGILIDGANPDPANLPANRALPETGAHYLMNFGAAFAGTTQPFDFVIKEIVISFVAPRLQRASELKSFGIFGDSYAANSVATNAGARMDLTVENELLRIFSRHGKAPFVSKNGGYPGYTMCVTGSNDLEAYWTTDTSFLDAKPQIVCCFAFNNDAALGESIILDPTNGSEQKCKEFLQACYNAGVEKVILATAGSMIADETLYTSANRANINLINNTIIPSIITWADSNLAAGFVKVFDLFSALGGDSIGSNYYQGELNYAGNSAVAGTGAYNDRHPSGIGHSAIAKKLAYLL